MIKGTSYTIAYTAYDITTGTPKTGDVANHTAYISYNGGSFSTISNAKTDRGYGVYVLTLTTAQTNYDTVVVQVVSSTANVYCPPVQLSFDASPLTAANVWSYSSRSVTSVPSTVATASALATVDSNVDTIVAQLPYLSTLTSSSIPTAAQNAAAVWSASSRTVTGVPVTVATASALTAVADNVNLVVNKLPIGTISDITTSDLPDITSLANDINVIESAIGTIQTACTTIEGYTDDVETLIEALPSASNIATATWSYASRSITAPVTVTSGSITQIQAGLARASQVGTVPTVLEITTGVWGAESRTLTSGGGEGESTDVSCIMNYLLNKPDIRE